MRCKQDQETHVVGVYGKKLVDIANLLKVSLIPCCISTLNQCSLLQLYPNSVPDLLSGNPLILYGRYHGNFPENVEVKGTFADFSNFEIGVKVHKVKDMPLERVKFQTLHIVVVS